jgi:phenylacetate-coenzyme A ligase PaaK-like adenylate-forming protein
MNKTPLENWIRDKLVPAGAGELTRQLIQGDQLDKLQGLLSFVIQESPFYRQRLSEAGIASVADLREFSRLPFTTPADLRTQGMKMLCTPLEQIERIVTLQTSGTTGEAKRVFFTAEDLAATADFFRCGMSTLVQPGETVIVLLPGERPDSVGSLLAKALSSSGVKPVVLGPVTDPVATRRELLKHPSACLVGIPTQILTLARTDVAEAIPAGWVKSVLLSTDYVPQAIQTELERRWGCRVLTHYGMTETGLGGGVECEAGAGYHLREADLYTEIIDPETGQPVPDGSPGEVVFTTLSRRGMPLIRYRTGDLARILPDPCPCGTVLKRLGRVQGRIDACLPLQQGMKLAMPDLDEALFPISGLLNFTARVARASGQDQLHLCLQVCRGEEERIAREALAVLLHREPLASLFRHRALALGGITFDAEGWFTSGTGKRQIRDARGQQILDDNPQPASQTNTSESIVKMHMANLSN